MCEIGAFGLLAGDLVDLEGEVPAQHIDAVAGRRVLAAAHDGLELGGELPHIAVADRRLDAADVNQPSVLDAV